MSELTGLRCVVIKEDPFTCAHPSWLKLKIPKLFPDEDSFLYFDADILAMKTWDVLGLFKSMGRSFMAVPDVRGRAMEWECKAHDIPYPDWYVNGGLLVFGQEHQFVLETAFNFQPTYGSWLEQTALNKALFLTGIEICRLPRQFNTLLWPWTSDYTPVVLQNRPETILHATCLGSDTARLKLVQVAAFGSEF